MPYTNKIEGIKHQISLLERELDRLEDMQKAEEDKQAIFIIETGICDLGKPYLICEQLPLWYDLDDIDGEIRDAIEVNEHMKLKEWSFRLANEPEEPYGLDYDDDHELMHQ